MPLDSSWRSSQAQPRPPRSFIGSCHYCLKTRPGLLFLTLKMMESMESKKRVLILCTGNSARSQMAEGLLRHDAGDRFEVFSAGTKPSSVRPEAIAAMRELGIDISGHQSKSVAEFAGQRFDYVLTVCDHAKESCPIFTGTTAAIHHNFEDPAAFQGSDEEKLAAFRRVRDQLRTFLAEFPESV
jgi:arsenate reductase